MNPPPCTDYRPEFDCDVCGCSPCLCTERPRRPLRGLVVRVIVVVLGLWVIGCVAGATARPWCD